MNSELQGFGILIWMRQFMTQETEFNPLTDHSIADWIVSDDQIAKAFKELPWCKRILANKQMVTRAQFYQRKSESNGKHQPDLMK